LSAEARGASEGGWSKIAGLFGARHRFGHNPTGNFFNVGICRHLSAFYVIFPTPPGTGDGVASVAATQALIRRR